MQQRRVRDGSAHRSIAGPVGEERVNAPTALQNTPLLIDVAVCLGLGPGLVPVWRSRPRHPPVDFSHDDEILSRQVVVPDGLAEDALALAVRVDCRLQQVPSVIQSSRVEPLVDGLSELPFAVSHD